MDRSPYKKKNKMNTIKEEKEDGYHSENSDTQYFNGDEEDFNNRDEDEEEEKELAERYH